MLRNRLYYAIKPLIPWTARMALRRTFATRKRERADGVWPIKAGTEQRPAGWPGWPGGKQFALVLTHDVEGASGLAKCRQLMDLEMDLGFRSSFSFIPEGGYQVPLELREYLTRNGFEIGVHDLHHDGKLYRSRQEFMEKAVRINRYLQEWGAVGFRSGFMMHNLEWLHELAVQYDSSTFDTDPFEPQPDGVGTIFPFWVSRPNGEDGSFRASGLDPGFRASVLKRSPTLTASSSGYVELPYTLPQDSTLFFLLREPTPGIWFQKLAWIAEHGGMALLNVHPDYVAFNGDPPRRNKFTCRHYQSFLKHVRERYQVSFWSPLPREVAALVRSSEMPSLASASDLRSN